MLAHIKPTSIYISFYLQVIDTTFARSAGVSGLTARLELICQEAEKSVQKGYTFIVLSDRNVSIDRLPIMSVYKPVFTCTNLFQDYFSMFIIRGPNL